MVLHSRYSVTRRCPNLCQPHFKKLYTANSANCAAPQLLARPFMVSHIKLAWCLQVGEWDAARTEEVLNSMPSVTSWDLSNICQRSEAAVCGHQMSSSCQRVLPTTTDAPDQELADPNPVQNHMKGASVPFEESPMAESPNSPYLDIAERALWVASDRHAALLGAEEKMPADPAGQQASEVPLTPGVLEGMSCCIT